MDVLAFIAGLATSSAPFFNVAGGFTLTALFATDRVLTRGQHERRVADMVKAHEKELASLHEYHAAILNEKDKAFDKMEKSRDFYRDAVDVHRGRADSATEALGEVSRELAGVTSQLLAAFDDVKGATT